MPATAINVNPTPFEARHEVICELFVKVTDSLMNDETDSYTAAMVNAACGIHNTLTRLERQLEDTDGSGFDPEAFVGAVNILKGKVHDRQG